MRAALYNGQKNIVMTELETPVAGDNDIVVRNSEYVLIPNAELGKSVYAVPEEISSKEASLI